MIIRIIQGMWKENSKKKNYCEGACDQNANKSHHPLYLWQQEQKNPNLLLL
jgi:hypothetical protein